MSAKLGELLKGFDENREIGIKNLLAATKRNNYSELENTVIYAQIMTFYSLAKNYSRVINLFEKYKKLNITNEYTNTIDIFCSAGIAYAKTENNKQAAKCLENYLRLYNSYKAGVLKTPDLTYRTPSHIGDFEIAVLTVLIVVYTNLDDDDAALRTYFKKKRLEKPDWDGTMLTIGMIVKNEEKVLEDCLKALSSLREKVKCELIIVDTGSVDKTVEIAEKYADEVRHFKWINDFSAARNESLRDAKGDWFMYLDADEIFESTDGIETFFTSAQHIHFNFGSYIVRNYVSDTLYADFSAPRLARIMENTIFHRSIHESIWLVPPTIFFRDYVHHKGYLGTNLQKKNSRNISNMLNEFAENPEDVSLIFQLAQSYLSVDQNVAFEFLNLGLQKAIDIKDTVWEAVFRSDMCFCKYNISSYEEAYKIAKESTDIYKKYDEEYCVCVDIYAVYTMSGCRLKKDFSEIKEVFWLYNDLYEKYKENKLASVDLMVRPAVYINFHPSQVVLNTYSIFCIANEEYEEAKKISLIKEKPQKKLEDLNYPYIENWFTIMNEFSDYSHIPELTTDIVNSDVDEKVRTYYYQWLLKEIMLVKEPEKNRGNLIRIIKESVNEQKEGSLPEDFVLLINAFDRFYNHGGMTEKEIADLFSGLEKFTISAADVIPLLMLFGHDLNTISDKLDYDFIKNSPEYIFAYSDTYADIISDYTSKIILERQSPRVQLLLINTCIYLLCRLDEETKYDADTITNITSTLTACYLESAYTAEVISEENSEHMSLPVRIGFYLFLSKISLADGKLKDSVMYLRKLLSFEPRLKNFISSELKVVMQSSFIT
ncbi:MAG: glycosyltransferase [Ruminococcus sp.]|jgi:glycosyltransferase involved in cell wall biosynthesis|nr:glycosyltransferase [Ruminococcus sp.]